MCLFVKFFFFIKTTSDIQRDNLNEKVKELSIKLILHVI